MSDAILSLEEIGGGTGTGQDVWTENKFFFLEPKMIIKGHVLIYSFPVRASFLSFLNLRRLILLYITDWVV